MRSLVLFVLFVLFSALAGGIGWWWFQGEIERRADAPFALSGEDRLEIERGMRLDDVIQTLATRQLTEDGWWIRRFAIHAGVDKQLKTGEYRLLPGDTARTLLQRIVRGDVIRYRFTLIEGWTVQDMLQALRTTSLRHTEGLNPSLLAKSLGMTHENPEGWFMPDTYDYVRSDTDVALLGRAHAAMQRALQQQWDQRDRKLPYEDSYAALIMASIIEKESGVRDERPLIASVFVRRLKLKMKLQTDPAVIYGLGSAFDGNLTRAHLESPTPYNTYTIPGLPPTPICLPSPDSLAAALNPPESDYLYFVGRGDGTSQFSTTLAEHNKAVNRYQRRMSGGVR